MDLSKVLEAGGVNPENIQKWITPLQNTFTKYDISTPQRVAMFIAQIAHESGSFRFLEENLNYSANGLIVVFPSYFCKRDSNGNPIKDSDGKLIPDMNLVEVYARQPMKIANRVYANRNGNGNEASGDGWKFRGRGCIGLTFFDNYKAFSSQYFNDYRLTNDPSPVSQPELAVASAGWFWWIHDLNDLADKGNIERCTKIINGGLNGYSDRLNKWKTIKNVLGI